MNFSFEGNYKPRRNINLGGVRKVDDKKSLMVKAQLERKQREQERLRLKSAERIQAFYRGRKQAALIRQTLRHEFESVVRTEPIDMITLTRQLLLFYQPEKDTAYLEQYAAQLTVMPTGDSWVWLVCLLIKKVLLPSIKHPSASHLFSRLLNDSDHHIRIMTFTLYHTSVFKTIKEAFELFPDTVESILYQYVVFYPPYDYPTSSLMEQYGGRNRHAIYMTRPALLECITRQLLTDPFFFDHFNNRSAVVHAWSTQLPLKDMLATVIDLFPSYNLDPEDIAGLLINLTEMGEADSGKHLSGVLTMYAKAVQLLLTHLPLSYLTDMSKETIIDQDSSDDDDDNDDDDVVMQEAKQPSLVISPLILARLESLYASDRIHELLYSFIQQQQSDIESIASFFNTLMLRWPSKKDSILNTLLYKSRQKTTQPLIHVLWESWSTTAMVFNEEHIMLHLDTAVKSLMDGNQWSILYLLCEVYARLLLTMGDDEFFSTKNPLELNQVVGLSRQLKHIAFIMFWRANTMDLTQTIGMTGIQLSQLRSSVTHLLQQIHMRE
ncbi:uncharacterized protein B0P05DRAFT_51125 [Gilbertella persicaria]|uniref:uncharacterized protein n=1 Tax=Gilbertella persicaria TaxID=101096 RepID=UPI00221FAF28|nr:uncharacterized protein B0P05DRAFT_51125 [Gilbertella persicaria]KAI8083325.1 hypothetical protein B0P05DRAFT_51125 [Gilbertella persicaria]